MKISRKYAAAIIIAVAVAVLSVSVWNWMRMETMELGINLKVGGNIGFDVNTSLVKFGTVPQGGIAVREIIITNKDGYDKTAHFAVEGDAKGIVEIPADKLVKADGNTTISVTARVPWDAKYGEYTGTLKIFLWRTI